MDVLMKALNSDSFARQGLSEEEQAQALRARVLALTSQPVRSDTTNAQQTPSSSSAPAAPKVAPSGQTDEPQDQVAAYRAQAAALAAQIAKLDALADSLAAQPPIAPAPEKSPQPETVDTLRAQVAALNQRLDESAKERADLLRKVHVLTAERDYLREVHASALVFAQRLIS
jgi:cell division protein FtsB